MFILVDLGTFLSYCNSELLFSGLVFFNSKKLKTALPQQKNDNRG